MKISQQQIDDLKNTIPELTDVLNCLQVFWINEKKRPFEQTSLPISRSDMEKANERWTKFMAYMNEVFPETNGIIQSPLHHAKNLQKLYLNETEDTYLLKLDSELPVAGSIKARGGFYEVFTYAEKLAKKHQLIDENESYAQFAEPRFKELFEQYTIGVGSTGNLGLSIGIMSAKLGFRVNVYMSNDAKQWKKDVLRSYGASVIECNGDFSVAIDKGREEVTNLPNGYFVDDENSKPLFLGYSLAAYELEQQLRKANIQIDEEHPLFVYLPCGVGGSPGGVAFGLKQLFGDHVHCFFVEPTHSPAVLLGLMTGLHSTISVQDVGIDNLTIGDGLAVGRPSLFATSISEQLIDGEFTVQDIDLLKQLYILWEQEQIFVEPSAAAGLNGPALIRQSEELQSVFNQATKATHIVWTTGGSIVPPLDKEAYIQLAKSTFEESKGESQ